MDDRPPDQPSSDDSRTTRHKSEAPAAWPDRIGPYRIVALIGEGAMGIVYEAEQERPRRRVALKIIRPGASSPALLRRFEHEYEFLGRLQHPGIAQIHQAGVAQTGSGPQPYFAMELVRGRRLDEYVRLRELGIRERLVLLAQVADAVQHAHHRGVIHRDLKPANILVTEAGTPKVLDFGLARAAEAEWQSTVQTMAGEVVGTMSYMSPEQVLGDVTELDTRSDVYALGVILYELVSGRLPFDLARKSFPEAVRVIRDEEPARLSSVVRSLPGDVETIVAKALEKDKLRRYSSAAELAEDIRRYLRDEPIVARPPSAAYQIRKFARRHTALVGGAAAVVVALVAGLAVSSWQAVRASRAERLAVARAGEAQSEKAKAEAVTKFLTEMLSSVNPSQAQGREVTVRTALDAAAKKVDGGALSRQPDVEAAVRTAIGTTYEGLGLYEPAERQLRTALDGQTRNGASAGARAETTTALVNLLYLAQRFPEGVAVAREAVRLRKESLGPKHPDVATSLDDLGALLMVSGEMKTAEPLVREALAMRRELLPPDHPELGVSLNNVGYLLEQKGNLREAESMYREALAIDRRKLGDTHPEIAKKLVNLSILLRKAKQYDASAACATEAITIRRKVLGNVHPALANAIDNLSNTLQDAGRRSEAEPLAREALAIARRSSGEESRETARLENNLAALLHELGLDGEAAPLARAAVAKARQAGGPDRSTVVYWLGLARTLNRIGDFRGAESAARDAVAVYRKQAAGPELASALVPLGAALVAQRRFADALPPLREAATILETHQPMRRPWVRPEAESVLGAALAGASDRVGAERHLVAGYEGLRAISLTPASYLRVSIERLVTFYTSTGNRQQAGLWRGRLASVAPDHGPRPKTEGVAALR